MLSEDVFNTPEMLSSPPESALSASPVTTGRCSPAPAATQTVEHQIGSPQHDTASQASMEIAWEGDAHSQVPVRAQLHQAVAATFISPDVSRLSMHQVPSLAVIIFMTAAVCRSLTCSPKFVSSSSGCSKWSHSA